VTELWVLVPSRGRPQSVDRLVRACALTCQADTKLHFAFDEDDPDLAANIAAAAGHRHTIGPRQGLSSWTNDLAMRHVKRSDCAALASIGDDMLPVTDGWDRRLLSSLPAGGGLAYPDDQRRADIPEAVVMSAHLVAALGWMAHPGMHHWFIDNVWRDLGHGAGCLVYCPGVLVQHLHPQVRPDVARPDATYADAAPHFNADMAVYQRWRLKDMRADIDAVKAARAAACSPPAE
jgi:hypothetical protein